MSFDSLSDFFNMGGYAFYVWLSYGFTAIILVLLTINSRSKEKQILTKLRQRIKRETKLKQAAQARTKELSQVEQQQGS
ncbi:heme exporter protein CcmD [Thalassotalea aquiviva]|uniref:heme exporter protein CcmD n=1 Tax=Thalassotalea aquiviva TaxID=3242415 RepID=UPI00352AE69F